MKQVQDHPLQARNESQKGKVNKALITFVDLFQRIAADSHRERLTNG
jgi:hypothetical protein